MGTIAENSVDPPAPNIFGLKKEKNMNNGHEQAGPASVTPHARVESPDGLKVKLKSGEIVIMSTSAAQQEIAAGRAVAV